MIAMRVARLRCATICSVARRLRAARPQMSRIQPRLVTKTANPWQIPGYGVGALTLPERFPVGDGAGLSQSLYLPLDPMIDGRAGLSH